MNQRFGQSEVPQLRIIRAAGMELYPPTSRFFIQEEKVSIMLKKLINKDKRGFTLIELLIVIAIIQVLASIAIPNFSLYRKKALNCAAKSDLRNAATAQEAYYADHDIYCDELTGLTTSPYSLHISKGVTMIVEGASAGYTITTYHNSGNKTYTLAGPGGTISH